MIDRSITDAEFAAEYLGGRSVKTARRTITADRIPHFKVNGRLLIKVSDAEAWRESKRVATEAPTLKSIVAAIAAKTLKKAGAA